MVSLKEIKPLRILTLMNFYGKEKQEIRELVKLEDKNDLFKSKPQSTHESEYTKESTEK